MAHEIRVGFSVEQLKESLDCLQNSVDNTQCSVDSLMRLSKALKDINEEVDLLRTVMQIGNNTNPR